MDQYTHIRDLGSGGFGRAVLCKHKTDKMNYAIKIIDTGSFSPEEKKKAKEEADVLKLLNHPYIVRYMDTFQEGINLYIVMEYCEGGDLLKTLLECKQNNSHLPEDQIWEYFIQICMALNYMHSRRVVHRDVKPHNIFVAKDGVLRLGDFGLAKVFSHSDAYAYASQSSTVGYCAPELISKMRYTNKCDIWSLGCVLYQMAMLNPPFTGHPFQVLDTVREGRYPPMLAHHSSELKNMVGRLINKEPIERPSITGILETDHIKQRAKPELRLKKLYDYQLHNGVLVDSSGKGFRHGVHGNKRDDENRYEGIAVLFEDIVYGKLEELGMIRLPVPDRPTANPDFDHPGSFIYATENWRDVERLLILIHGGHGRLVKAGQWTRRLMINESIDKGTQLPYIRKAIKCGYGVVTMNTTDIRKDIPGCTSPGDHAGYVWRNYIAKSSAVQIAIKAHSAGGSTSLALFSEFETDFKRRVYANALTGYGASSDDNTQEYIKKVTRNWTDSSKPLGTILPPKGAFQQVSAGTRSHEEIPYKSIEEIFRFMEERFEDATPGNM